MQIDHIFVFTDAAEAAAAELRAFGLREAPGRVHPGQGTANRKFCFENFFLELLWVVNEAELLGPATRPSLLWQRARYREHGASPYGLCLVNTPDTDALFAAATPYQPDYFPAGQAIAVLAQAHNPSLPWTFRLPFRNLAAPLAAEPPHPNGLHRLTTAVFGLEHYDAADGFAKQLAGEAQLQLQPALRNSLTLVFDHHRQQQSQRFDQLGLTIHY